MASYYLWNYLLDYESRSSTLSPEWEMLSLSGSHNCTADQARCSSTVEWLRPLGSGGKTIVQPLLPGMSVDWHIYHCYLKTYWRIACRVWKSIWIMLDTCCSYGFYGSASRPSGHWQRILMHITKHIHCGIKVSQAILYEEMVSPVVPRNSRDSWKPYRRELLDFTTI